MKSPHWRDVVAAMKEERGKPAGPAPDRFWANFRAHAALRPQWTPETADQPAAVGAAWAWARPAWVVAVCVLAAGLWWGAAGRGPTPIPARASRVSSLDVVAQHGAVMIMNDEATQSTIVWIVDMELGGRNGGNT